MDTQILKLAESLEGALVSGRKLATVRAGARFIQPGALYFEIVGTDRSHAVQVVETRIKRAAEITIEEALLDGAASPAELRQALRTWYPDMQAYDTVTVVIHTPPWKV